jgi:hypothetical protein
MESVSIKIIDTELENDLILFSINDKINLCFSKNHSYTLKEFIQNMFRIAMRTLEEDIDGSEMEIVNLNEFDDSLISYDSMTNNVYKIQYIKRYLKEINYEIEL